MAHKTLIGGTAYEITGGKTLIGGTAYEISKGRTLISGTGYDISFGPPPITFYLYGSRTTYTRQAAEGMTWGELVNSDQYNADGAFKLGWFSVNFNSYTIVANPLDSDLDSSNVNENLVIIAGHTYGLF